MLVTKRNGKLEEVNLNKILKRLKNLAEASPELTQIDPLIIAQKVINGLYDKVSTRELDELAAETAAAMSTTHPEYDTLAARIEVSNLHKETSDKFSTKIRQLYKETGIISKSFYEYVLANASSLDSMVDYQRDYLFDYFGVKTLKRAYLLKTKDNEIVERPQDMWMRVSAFIHQGDLEATKETYDFMSQKYFTHATPTLFNAGTVRPQLSSCFLLDMAADSITGIYKTLADCATISQSAGGIGLAIHKIRASGSYIHGTNGVSNGITPMLRVFDATARYVDQGGGKRKGSIAIYVEPWHADIFEFLDLKKNHGKEELRARDLFYALWIPDLFMKRVQEDGVWTLFDPAEAYVELTEFGNPSKIIGKQYLYDIYGEDFNGIYKYLEKQGKGKQVKARELWEKILANQIETGVPYILYKDACNEKSNQKNLGTIKSSNLCVTGDTKVLTAGGHKEIALLPPKTRIWNGQEWSQVDVFKTGENQELLKVTLSNGAELKCTPYHKWYVKNNYFKPDVEVRTHELKIGDKLVKFDLPIIEEGVLEMGCDYYTHGAFCADGTYNTDGSPRLSLYGYKKELIPHLEIKSSTYKEDSAGRINCQLSQWLPPKMWVPETAPAKQRLQWLAGYLDFDGCLTNNKGTQSIQVASIDFEFLNKIRLILQTLGVDSKIVKGQPKRLSLLPDGHGGKKEFNSKKIDRLLIGETGIQKLIKLGIKFNRLAPKVRVPNREATQFVKVVSITQIDNGDTYCVNEPLRNKVVFNGILTGNCTEIIEYTDDKETAVCNLASISLPAFINEQKTGLSFDKLYEISKIITRNLNKVIDVNYYPTPETRYSNFKHRPIGIGVQGLADVYAVLKYDFDSEEAKGLNKKIFEVIYKGACDASIDLARQLGAYESYSGSPASRGLLQFDLWGLDRASLSLSWDETFKSLDLYGLRNSLLLAPMPTASTSQILGNNEAFEPFTSNLYTRRTLAGEFIVVNKYLIKELIDLGLWNETMRQRLIAANGSVQGIAEIPAPVRSRYRTAYEMSARAIIDQASDRGPFICQSQSMNIFMPDPTIAKLTSMHFYGWQKGLKTGSYYIRSEPARDAIKFTINKEHIDETKNAQKVEEPTGAVCNLDDPNCEACSG